MASYIRRILICLLIIVEFYHVDCESTLEAILESSLPEDGKMNFTQLAEKYGRPAEQRTVITEDGYILTVFRLPGLGPPVLLCHGLGDTADGFILYGNGSLVMTLSHAGYDVWVGNFRGNRYSRRHVKLNPDTDMQFWDFSFDEMGYYDLAATIDHIRNETGEHSVSIIGHSQGAAMQYVLASLRPEYNSRIKVSIALSPSVVFNHPARFLSLISSVGPIIDTLLGPRYQEILGEGSMLSNLFKYICSRGNRCFNFSMHLVGLNTEDFNYELLKVIIGHIPSSVSRKNLMHINQMLLKLRFCRYDYGWRKNLEKYGTAVAPDYDLAKVTMPTALFEGKSDKLVTVKDLAMLRDRLPNVIHYEEMAPKLWNHMDFVWGSKMGEYLFPTILSILKEFDLSSESESVHRI